MQFKNKLLFALAFVGSLAMASCTSTPAVEKPDEIVEGTTISFYGWGSAEEQANFRELVDYYNENNEHKIHVTYSASDSSTFMTNLQNYGNNLPDVFYMPDYNFMQWAESGKLMQLDGNFEGAITKTDYEKIWPYGVSMYRYDTNSNTLGEGALYGLPKDLGPYTLVYNVDMMNEVIKNSNGTVALPSGSEPMTFDEMSDYLSRCQAVLDKLYTDKTYALSSYEIMPAVYSNGTDFYKDNGRKSNVTDPRFTEAIQWIADLNLEYGVMPSANEQTGTNGYVRFTSGRCLFTFMGPWDLKAFWEGTDFDFDIIPVAKGNHDDCISTAWVGSVAYCISNFSKHKSEALDFVKFLALSEESSRMNYELGQAMPNIVEMAQTDFVNNVGLTGRQLNPANKQLFVDITLGTDTIQGKGRAAYFCPSDVPYNSLLDQLTAVWNGQETAEEHFASYDETFQHDLDMAYEYY